MKSLKLFSMIALVAMMSACQGDDPTVVKFTSADQVAVDMGKELNFDVTVRVDFPNGETSFVFDGLPDWVSKTEGTNKVTLKGTAPDKAGEFPITIKATNNKVTTTQNLVIKVGGVVVGDILSVAQAIANQSGEVKWVQGYIVGCVANGVDKFDDSSQALFSGFNSSTNVFIADNASETDYTKCLNVKLNESAAPAGFRNAVNLLDHPENKGKILKVQGALRSNFTTLAGIRDIVDFVFETPDPNDNDPEAVTSLTEDFEGFGSAPSDLYFAAQPDNKGWYGFSIAGTLQPDMRKFNENQYVQFSAHRNAISGGILQEFWAVSPRLDVSAATNKNLTFYLAGGYYNASTIFEVYVLDGKDPATANKTKLNVTLPTAPASGYGTLASIGNIDLSGFSGVIRIGFYYKGTSGSGNSTTWQLDNFTFN